MTYRLMDSFAYLLNRAGTRSGELFSRRLLPYGITLTMYRVLAALGERNDQRLSDLASMTSIELSTLSRLVSTMMCRGMVFRERVDGDGRTVAISLTASGRDLVDELIPLATRHEQVGLQNLAPHVVAQLKRSLVAIHDNLDALEDELPAAKRSSARAAIEARTPPADWGDDE